MNSGAASDRQKARDAAFRLLAVRPRSRKELDTRLRRKGFPRELIDDTLNDFAQQGYQSDEEFARLYAQEKWRRRGWGPNRLKMELAARGIAPDLIEHTIADTVGDADLVSALLPLARKRWLASAGLPDAKRKQRLIGFLQRRGHGWDVIGPILSELARSARNDEL